MVQTDGTKKGITTKHSPEYELVLVLEKIKTINYITKLTDKTRV